MSNKKQDQSPSTPKSAGPNTKTASEVFRHLRPHWYNRTAHTLEPHKQGGVSFLLLPSGQRRYSFWIYICPEDAPFSSRQAVKTLRDVVKRDVVPWGTITLTEEPVLEQLTRFIIHESAALPSEVGHQVLKMVMLNAYAEWKYSERKGKYSDVRKHYTES